MRFLGLCAAAWFIADGHQALVPDVRGRQGLKLPRQEQLPVAQLVLQFLGQPHHLRVLQLFFQLPWGRRGGGGLSSVWGFGGREGNIRVSGGGSAYLPHHCQLQLLLYSRQTGLDRRQQLRVTKHMGAPQLPPAESKQQHPNLGVPEGRFQSGEMAIPPTGDMRGLSTG